MDILFDALNPTNFANLFTLMWVGAIVICVGASIVYWIAQRRYRRYPAHMAMHEWVYWTVFVAWIVVPLLAVIHVPLFLVLAVVIPGMALAAFGVARVLQRVPRSPLLGPRSPLGTLPLLTGARGGIE